ncbi:MAG: hypothetical protein H6589_07565 [Flavobacteriales bacterium]|nr:hypothetical protein [Flavobacteriales bacterium]
MKLIGVILCLLLVIKSFSQENDKLIYERTIIFFTDSILKGNNFDKKLKIFFKGETSKSISYVLPYSECFNLIDTFLLFKEEEKELETDFWKKNEKEAIKVSFSSRISAGEVRGIFCNRRKRNMILYQFRVVGDYKFITIKLSNKDAILGEDYSILMNSKNEIINWCSGGWVR